MSGLISEELIQRVVDKLVANYAPRQVILFGSYACGAPDADSDIDLLIIKDTDEPFFERMAQACQSFDGTRLAIPCDILVLTPDEANRRLSKGDHFIEDIVEKGRSLYGEASWKEERECVPSEEPTYPTYPMEWLINAERDLRRASLMFDNEDPAAAGFFIQQALEKALKAFLLHNGWRLERTHNLVTLLNAGLDYDAGLESRRALCKQVNSYYFAERYPDSGMAEPGMPEVRDSLGAAQELVAKIREAITG